MAQTFSAISGLQADPDLSHSKAQAQVYGVPSAPAKKLQLSPPRSGRVGQAAQADVTMQCGLVGHRVPYAEHRCYMCSYGYSAEQLAAQGFTEPPFSKAEAD